MILSKKTRIQTKDHNDSLIAQVNSKTVENADLKAQIQEKVFANVALKNELRKLKGNSVDTKFAKPSILGKPVLQPPRNQSVVRQPNAFKSERLKLSKPRFASHVDVNYGFVKKTRNSQEETVWFNDMDHNHYLEDARKKGNKKGNRNQNLVSLFNDRCVAMASADNTLGFYFNPPPHAVSPDQVAVAAPRAVDPTDSPSSTTIDQDVPLLVLHQQIRKFNLKSLIKLTKNHPLENVIGDPSRPVSTRSQLQEHAIWCYFDANVNPIPFGGK
ncbi:hypothetical protein Tco_1131901 [Tanacetum coccineum]|uniref:Uncharacterized protein n=1 Tax=Tanacetum coccineum TaxID=301880 RepID=A0ABQ5JBS5_9ASTR